MTDPRVTFLFDKLPENYPRRLERDHAHILNRLVELWPKPEFDAYMHDLLINKRGRRRGFTLEVVAELMSISEMHKTFKSEGLRFPELSAKPLESWASIGVANPTPQGFQQAIEHGQNEVVCSFLDAGVSVDFSFEGEKTPLIIASMSGQVDVVRSLLDRGAGVNIHDEGKYTALHWAAFYRNGQIVSALIDAGATINATQNSGDTALALAVTRGYLDIVRLLLEHRADPNVGKTGSLPLSIALHSNNIKMIELLGQHGAHS